MEAANHTLNARPVRTCEVCGLAVGMYEPAVFMFGGEIIHSSRAAEPALTAKPGCCLQHKDCYFTHAFEPLRLVAD